VSWELSVSNAADGAVGSCISNRELSVSKAADGAIGKLCFERVASFGHQKVILVGIGVSVEVGAWAGVEAVVEVGHGSEQWICE
jgi:hypothetical protein